MKDILEFDLSKLDALVDINKRGMYKVFLEKEEYSYEEEELALKEMKNMLTCEESLVRFYRKILQENQKPDLLGKTVECNEKQFSNLYELVKKISSILNVQSPKVFIYEDVFYRAEVDGYDEPWIIISSNMVQDYTKEELLFVLGKLLGSIKSEHYKYEAISKALDNATNYVDKIPVINIVNAFNMIDGYKMNLLPKINCWRRCCNYSADICGFLISGSFKASVNAILKDILNNSKLVEEVDLKDYLSKVEEIKSISGKMIDYSKLDETVPYGPYRILNILQYTATDRCNNALLKLSREEHLWG